MRSSLSSTQVANRFAYSKRNVSILTNLSRNSCSLQTAKSQNTSPHDIARDIPCIASTTCRIGNVSFNFLFFSKRSVTILKFQRKFRQKMSARFSKKNIGHFGLGFEYYTHFTSPIRRYPDLIVHRILENLLSGNQQKFEGELRELEDIAANSTDKEIAAAEAERASIKYKQVEYMAEKVGQTFVGTISGVTE